MRKTAQALSLCPNCIGENLCKIDPNDSTLGESKERDVTDQQPKQKILMSGSEEDYRHSGQACCGSYRSDQQQRFATDPVYDRHRYHSEKQIRATDGNRLKVAGNLAEPRVGEDMVQVVENRVDPRELIEHSNAHCQKNRECVLA